MILNLIGFALATSDGTGSPILNTEGGFSTPHFLTDSNAFWKISMIVFSISMIIFLSIPGKKIQTYQFCAISNCGVLFGAHHMFLHALGSPISTILLVVIGAITFLSSIRKETKALTRSIANMYFVGYIVLMLLSVNYKVAGIPMLLVIGALDYFLISLVKSLHRLLSKTGACVFLACCAVYPIFDIFDGCLSMSMGFFDPHKMISKLLLILDIGFFFFIMPLLLAFFFPKKAKESEEDSQPKDNPEEKV